jgi:hypothetical protein
MDTNEAIRQIQDITRRVEPSDRSKCVAGALVEAFDWSRSEQGSDYWDNIHMQLLILGSRERSNLLYRDDDRGYELIVRTGGPDTRFIAGCRFFTLEEALEHWGPDSRRRQPKYIEAIEAWVARQDATIKAVDQDTTASVG